MRTQDYKLLADIFAGEIERLDLLLKFKGSVSPYNEGQVEGLKMALSSVIFGLSQADGTFDKAKFLKDCGVGHE